MRKRLVICAFAVFGALLFSACAYDTATNSGYLEQRAYGRESTKQQNRIAIDLGRSFNIGMEYNALPQTEEEYIAAFARQLATYNQIAPYLWVGNIMVNMSAVIGNYNNREQFWFIYPDGTFRELTRQEISTQRPYHDFDDGSAFWFQEYGTFFEDNTGFYSFINMSEGSAETDINRRREQIGRGNVEHMSMLLHGAGHAHIEGATFEYTSPIPTRADRPLDTEARLMRALIIEQLLDALASPDDISYVLKVLSSFRHYQKYHNEDYLVTRHFDTAEGITQWFDVAGTLFAAYPEQIKTDEDLHAAFSFIARYHREGTWWTQSVGAVREAYIIGSLAGFLLDRYIDRFDWQIRFTQEITNPLQLLLDHFEESDLPEFNHVFTQEQKDAVDAMVKSNFGNVAIVLGDFVTLLQSVLPEYDFAVDDFEAFISAETWMMIEAGWILSIHDAMLNKESAEGIVRQILGRDIVFDFVQGHQWDASLGSAPKDWTPVLVFRDAFAIVEYLEKELSFEFLSNTGNITINEAFTVIRSMKAGIDAPYVPNFDPAFPFNSSLFNTDLLERTPLLVFNLNSTTYLYRGEEQESPVAMFDDVEVNQYMLPLRIVAEALGFEVEWDGQTQSVTMTRSDEVIVVTVGVQVIGEMRPDVINIPTMVDGRVFIPASFASFNMGAYGWGRRDVGQYIIFDRPSLHDGILHDMNGMWIYSGGLPSEVLMIIEGDVFKMSTRSTWEMPPAAEDFQGVPREYLGNDVWRFWDIGTVSFENTEDNILMHIMLDAVGEVFTQVITTPDTNTMITHEYNTESRLFRFVEAMKVG
ncbi:MAG: copper amine oxidase N-terminal domain-containing protein [Defluviitaleaceae bacterium]|nr:copper amine oxidase N-terminal domain-containing protein [Defluviitaleaceae bacterium]